MYFQINYSTWFDKCFSSNNCFLMCEHIVISVVINSVNVIYVISAAWKNFYCCPQTIFFIAYLILFMLDIYFNFSKLNCLLDTDLISVVWNRRFLNPMFKFYHSFNKPVIVIVMLTVWDNNTHQTPAAKHNYLNVIVVEIRGSEVNQAGLKSD